MDFFLEKDIFFPGRLRRPYGTQLLNLGRKILSGQMLPPIGPKRWSTALGTDEGGPTPTGRSFLNRMDTNTIGYLSVFGSSSDDRALRF